MHQLVGPEKGRRERVDAQDPVPGGLCPPPAGPGLVLGSPGASAREQALPFAPLALTSRRSASYREGRAVHGFVSAARAALPPSFEP